MPFITADILMSSKEGRDKLILPTNSFDINPLFKSKTNLRPDSFAQKLYIIGKNVCVAVAGSEYELRKFLRELRSRCNLYNNINEKQIRQFLEDYNLETQFVNSAFFLVFVEYHDTDSIYVGMFNYPGRITRYGDINNGGWRFMESEVFDKIYSCGSGADSFLNLVSQAGTFDSQYAKGDPFYAMQSNVVLNAQFLAIEQATLHNLETNWGGGFETAFFNGHEFEKVSDIVYVICHGSFDERGNVGLPLPNLFLYYTYIEEILYIVKVEVERFSVEYKNDLIILFASADSFVCNCFEVKGLEGNENVSTELKDFSYETHIVAIGYSIPTPDNGVFTPASLNLHESLKVSYVHGKSIEMVLSEDINKTLNNSFKEVFNHNCAR
jgi:hypothetical protein